MVRKIFSFKNLYLFSLILLLHYYFNGKDLFQGNVSEIINDYFGRSRYILFFILVINYFTTGIKDNKKRDKVTILSHSLYLVYLAFYNLLISAQLGLIVGPVIKNKDFLFLDLSIFKYKTGIIATYLISNVVNTENRNIFWLGIAMSLIIITCFVLGVLNLFVFSNIKDIKTERLKKKNIKNKENDILQKIQIREAIEKTEIEQLTKQEKEKEQRIKEKVIEMAPILGRYTRENSFEKFEDENEDGGMRNFEDENQDNKIINFEDENQDSEIINFEDENEDSKIMRFEQEKLVSLLENEKLFEERTLFPEEETPAKDFGFDFVQDETHNDEVRFK